MSEITLHLVGPETRQFKRMGMVGFIGIGLFGFGFLLDKMDYPLGTILEAIGLPLVLLMIGWTLRNQFSGNPSHGITKKTVCFRPDVVVIGDKHIDLRAIRAIEAAMAYKGGPAYSSPKYLSDGTGNVLKFIYKDSKEVTITFYLNFSSQLQLLEEILGEAKQRHGFTLIM
ncbi:hypothetical protein JAO73_17420 [Hymenobacter sp. BT523]|uniref:hypothetical protein n=1 Tax=Hymenobacter sp. BT523 TaxID=2795725 RepID=UPI0018ED1B1B|nr:hypothetical protein [Hymenobacter sp. BT523]MBJ6110808.1 hypothetical protein [Hymenobacter sp. BT523]